MPTYHLQQTWRAKRPKTVVSHYLENPPKPPENEFAKDCSKSNAILKRCVLCDYKEKESGGVKKKPMIILKEFILVSTSGASDWQACEDSQWNKRTTFVFRKILIYSPWTWKQSEDSLKLSLTPKRSEFTGVQKLFLLWREIGDKIDRYISYRVFFLREATKGAGD